MKIWDIITLLATGLVAIYLIWRFFQHYRKSASSRLYDIYYIVAFAVLLIAGLLLIFLTYDVLSNKLVVIVAALIPLGISLGLVKELIPKYEKLYLTFASVGFVALAVTRYTGPANLATAVLAIVHTVAGLLIFSLPIWAIIKRKALADFIGVTIGGALIGIGGIALAFLKTGNQLLFLNNDVVLGILAPLLLLMTLAFAWGFVKRMVHARS
jgi:hypothetical protein